MRDLLSAALERLGRLEGVRGALIVDAQAGVPVATGGGAIPDPDVVAALTTVFVDRLTRAVGAAEFGRLGAVQLTGEMGNLVVSATGDLLVVVVAEAEARLEPLCLEARRVAEELR